MVHLPHLETNVTVACQNRCVACNHFVPLLVGQVKARQVTPEALADDLAHFARIAHVDGYALLGGEPTLHPAIVELLDVARASGVADQVEVWTNGQTLRRLPDAFWGALDVLVISVYPGKLEDADLAWGQARAAEAGVQVVIKDERHHPNFTQLLEPAPTDAATTRAKYRACWFKTYSRVLDDGIFYRCCTSPFIADLLQGRPRGADGIPVRGLTEEALRAFLAQSEPMPSCTICAGRNTPSAQPIPWAEIRDPQAWLAASAGRPA